MAYLALFLHLACAALAAERDAYPSRPIRDFDAVGLIATSSPVLPHVISGRLRALATAGTKRSQVIPELVTVAESGLPGFTVSPYFGVLGPAHLPKNVIAKLNSEIQRIFQLPDSKERLTAPGFDATPQTPQQFMSIIKSEMNMWGDLIKQNKITLE